MIKLDVILDIEISKIISGLRKNLQAIRTKEKSFAHPLLREQCHKDTHSLHKKKLDRKISCDNSWCLYLQSEMTLLMCEYILKDI